jgi:hypothetical protein
MMLDRNQCLEIHKKNAGKLVWLDQLAANDGRLILRNEDGLLYAFMDSEWDQEEQAQAARLCAAVNSQRKLFEKPAPAQISDSDNSRHDHMQD